MGKSAETSPRLHTFLGNFDRVILEERFTLLPGISGDHVIVSGNAATNAGLASVLLAQNINPNLMVSGLNGTTALATRDTAGGVTLTTAGASGDQMILSPNSITGQSEWLPTLLSTVLNAGFEASIVTAANIADINIWAGLKLTQTGVIATDNDQAYFRYSDVENGGKWQCVTSATNVDISADSGIAVAASTKYVLRVEIDSGTLLAHFFINGNEVAITGTNKVTTAITALKPSIGVQATAIAAKAITVRGVRISVD